MSVEKLLYSRREAASALGISLRTVDTLLRTRVLPARKIRGRVLVPVKALERLANVDERIIRLRKGVE